MKSLSKQIITAATLAGHVAAFPHMAMRSEGEVVAADVAYKRLLERQSSPPQGSGALPLTPPPFDAASQLVDVTGEHAFTPPSSSDARGPCPGLNALANHNYIPHNGVATITEFVDATTSVFGMGVDLATFLATYGAVLDGDGTSWSIAGAPHTGIGGSHSHYETDSSPIMPDLYQYGYNEPVVLSQFKTLYDMQQDAATANYNLDVLRTFRNERFAQSIAQNPYFYYGPVSGMAVSQAAFTFIYRFMANHSAEYPEGVLNQDVLKSFYSVSGNDADGFTWTRGNERIPDNWYRRNEVDAYTIPYFETDVLYFTASNPQLSLVGCNAGKLNSYQTIDPSIVSNGAYTAAQAAQSPLCFALAAANAEAQTILGLDLGGLLSPLTSAINTATGALGGCTTIGTLNTNALGVCPGFALYAGPTATVAPGAIQDGGF